ncbi:expressed unknown protein [Seminavis robusta]|uniref:Uncharacterized protein n=1 Tax=Seminavis robusta TaxID=568900 RepID=A0A9N8H6F4_9STRA|nr:expressed unknown protein [Seminavis robusta]|eukprot:Sro110_g055050.1 n/a (301) ;mRNA; f:97625-98527
MKVLFLLGALWLQHIAAFSNVVPRNDPRSVLRSTTNVAGEEGDGLLLERRQVFQTAAAASLLVGGILSPRPANAVKMTGPGDGLLDELPPEAVRSYTQYRIPLQIFADFYIYDLQRLVENVEEWGDVGQLFVVNRNRGQGSPSRIERDFTNPVRILGLSLPPEFSDRMIESQYKFEKAMSSISKATSGIRRDLPVEIDKNAVKYAKAGWEDGRVAINEVFAIINEATGLTEMKAIPEAGGKQFEQYGRSPRRYFDLVKKTKLCQNRGGPALSSAWGGLMISGYMQDSCGIPDLDDYFYQT